MVGLLLVSLSKGIPIFDIIADILIPSNKRLLLIDPDDFDDFNPLICNIAFLILLDDG